MPAHIKRPKGKAVEEPGVLFIRNVPAEVLAALDAWVNELKAERPGFGSITRTDLVRDIISRTVKEHAAHKP